MLVFKTKLLIVRQLKLDDFAGFHEMQSNPNVMQYAHGDAKDEFQNSAELEKCINCYTAEDNNFWIWAIIRKSDDAFVGTCALVKDDDDDNEIGYRFLESMWGQGYGREVCNGLVEHAIETMKLPSLVANVDSRNVASVRILEASRLVRLDVKNKSGCECDLIFRWRR